MAMVVFRCDRCGQQINSPMSMAGERIGCPSCGAPQQVPGSQRADRPAPAQAAFNPTSSGPGGPSSWASAAAMPAGAGIGTSGWSRPEGISGMAMRTPRCSRIVYVLLGVFLGWLGIHNFAAGYTPKAITQLVLGAVGALTFGCVVGVFMLLGVFIWAIVDVITVTKDVDGVAME